MTSFSLHPNLLTCLRELCQKADVSSKHSAIIFKGSSKIVATGYNTRRNCIDGHPVCAQHAETSAIKQLLSHLSLRSFLHMGPNGTWRFLRDYRIKKEA
jgi:tRNA(Arg) A34 adenosine deaminase TadA